MPLQNTMYSSKLLFKNYKFIPPFDTYFYRDVIWRVGYSNEQIIKAPNDYEHKIKIYIGRGNNSRLIRSIINRRTWYQITDKV